MPEFKALWSQINAKSVYVVDFDTDELVNKAIAALDAKLHVPKIFFKVESGAMEQIKSKEDLLSGASFVREESAQYGTKVSASSNVKYDLIGKLVDETGLTRKAIVQILQGIKKSVFDQFKDNPEECIIRAEDIINDEKATAIIQHITYNALDEHYETDVFTEPTIKGKRLMNQAIFEKIYVVSNEDIPLDIEGEYKPPFDTILAPANQESSENTEQTQDIAKGRIQNSHGCGHFADNSTFMRSYSKFFKDKISSNKLLVEIIGIEPLTS